MSSHSPTLFAVIFEGRTGSSELIARLNSHTDIQAFPEILAPLCPDPGPDGGKWDRVEDILVRLRQGRSIDSFCESYSKVGPELDNLPVRGLKTRLNTAADRWWYELMNKTKNYYAVEPNRFLSLAQKHRYRLIRLRRKDLLRHAVSWIRAIRLDDQRQQWNVNQGQRPLGPMTIPVEIMHRTLRWLAHCRREHDAAYESYCGPKMIVTYEELMASPDNTQASILEFLGLPVQTLAPHHVKATPQNLREVVLNFDEIIGSLRAHSPWWHFPEASAAEIEGSPSRVAA